MAKKSSLAGLTQASLDSIVNDGDVKQKDPGYTRPVDVTKEGLRLVIPDGMTYRQAMKALEQRAEEEEQTIRVYEPIDTYPSDGVHALMKVLGERFGWANLIPTPGFFGDTPPTMIGVESSATTRVSVPWGRFAVPNMDGWLGTHAELHDGNVRFVMVGEIKRKHERLAQEIAESTRRMVRVNSLYRGKAIRVVFPDLESEHFNPVTHSPRFIDTSAIRENELVLPKNVQDIVEASLWTPIQATQLCRDAKIPLKRGILFEGIPGTGKTLTAGVTSKYAEQNGWTYIYLENPEQLASAIRFARQYQPAVVFTEDIDRADEGRGEIMNALLNVIDGVETKGAEVIVVVTTNDVSSIPHELLRPGRLDAIVSYVAPDAEAVQRLVRLYARGTLAEGEDLVQVGKMLVNNIPATIREVVERSKLTAIGRLHREGATSIDGLTLTAKDIEVSAATMMAHAALLAPEEEDERSNREKAADTIADALVTVAGALAATQEQRERI